MNGMENNIYSEKYTIINEDVSNSNSIKISRLFDILHETANHSLIEKKMDIDNLMKKNLLWVLAEQCAEIKTLPSLYDTITIQTWVGKEFSTFIPRFYEIKNSSNKSIIKTSAIWTLLDKNTRKSITPSKAGVIIPKSNTGTEINFLCTPKSLQTTETLEFIVEQDFLDKNNHLNNAKYFEIINNWSPLISNNSTPKSIIARYSKEAFLNDKLTIKKGVKNSSAFYTINSTQGNHLKLRIEY